MFLRTILLNLVLIGFANSSTHKLLYIQVITKNLKQNQLYECVSMDPNIDTTITPVLNEAAREEKSKPNIFKRFGKFVGVTKGPKAKFTCMGAEIDKSQIQWVCKKITKIARPSLKPVMCQHEVKTVYVIKSVDRKIYGLCLDASKFYVFTFSPDVNKCPLEMRGMSHASEALKKALLSAAYATKGCAGHILRYFDETWEGFHTSIEREEEISTRVSCFFGLIENVQKAKLNYVKQFETIVAMKHEAEKGGYQLQLSPTSPSDTDPFITQKDLDALHDSVMWNVRKYVTTNHFNQAKHALKLEALNVNDLEKAYNADVEKAKQDVIVDKSEPVNQLIMNNNLSFNTVWKIARWFMISQPKYRRLLVTRVMLARNIKDTCIFRENLSRLALKDHALKTEAKLDNICKASCSYIADVGNTLVFKNIRGEVSVPVCLHFSSGSCNREDNKCYCIGIKDKQGPLAVTKHSLQICQRDVEVSLRAMRIANNERKAKIEEARKKTFETVWNG